MNGTGIGNGAVASFPIFGAIILLGIALASGASANAQTNSMLGVDVNPDTNSPASLGTLETCASHEVGDQFQVDLYVNNVTDLRSWELRIQYDEDVLQIASVDYAHFLVSTGSGGNVFPSLQETEAPGREFLAAAELQGSPDSGSGVLARLTMDAISEGSSPIRIVHSPVYLGPRLNAAFTGALGDSNGDGIWDASIIDSEVVVGGDCDNAPVVTPKPSPAPTPRASGSPPPGSPAPGDSTPAPTSGGPAGTDDETPRATGQVVLVPGGNDGIEPNGGGDGDGPDNVPGESPTGGGGNPGSQDDVDNEGTGSVSSGDDEGGGSASPWLLLVGLAAAIFISAGAVLYVFSRQSAR